MVLEKINHPNDIKNLKKEELPRRAGYPGVPDPHDQ